MKEDMGEEGTEIEEGSKKMAREGKKRRRCRKRGQRADRWRSSLHLSRFDECVFFA